jgi:peptidoglycan hydrolase FlgJ
MQSLESGRAEFYYSQKGLDKIKQKSEMNSPEALAEVAEQFETLLVDMMVSSMRGAGKVFEEGNLFSSHATEFYQGMYDKQLAQELVHQKGFGLAEVLSRQLSKQYQIAQHVQSKPEKTAFDHSRETPMKIGVLPKDFDERLKKASALMDTKLQVRAGKSIAHLHPSTHLNSQAGLHPPATKSTPAENLKVPPLSRVSLQASHSLEAGSTASSLSEEAPFFETVDEFIETLTPMAEKVALELGVDPAFLLAQAALETGWGKHIMQNAEGESSYNLFGIKASNDWRGKTVDHDTTEFIHTTPVRERSSFRVYDSYEDSFRDYAAFLKENSRYEKVLYSKSAKEFAQNLQAAGYATDPLYSQKMISVYKRMSDER